MRDLQTARGRKQNMYAFATATWLILILFVRDTETSAQVVLITDPQRSNVILQETVYLTCEVRNSALSNRWKLSWKRRRGGVETTLSSAAGEGFSAYFLNKVVQSDSALYWCEATAGYRRMISSTHSLTVTPPPPAVLTLEPARGTFYPSEKVTLKCDIQNGHIRWTYLWFRDRASLGGAGSGSGSEFTIPALDLSHGGSYYCRGQTPGRAVYTEKSDYVTLAVDGNAPKPLLTLDSPSGEVVTGDTVTLSCRVGADPAGWKYLWYRGTQTAALTSTDSSSTDGPRYTIRSAAESHRGEYWCRAGRGSDPFYTLYSASLKLDITAVPPMVLTLQTGWTNIFNGEGVTLHCDIQDRSPVWMYRWYRDGQELPVDTTKDAYEILSADQSDSGMYACKGQHKERVLYTGSSNMIELRVSGNAPKPLLTLDSPSGEVVTGDTVTLSCRVGADPAGWKYLCSSFD
ncbi:Fc receptor-like protein 5 [Conger conger]|uniref:Fc receptor-like protein 5 n=1 Tax=Conger conger TaxID=82655 RepID=UPI002A59C5AC|nr:Fc receptor-like protein 5 [Conger conger]